MTRGGSGRLVPLRQRQQRSHVNGLSHVGSSPSVGGVDGAGAALRDQARGALEGGVERYMLETCRDVNEIVAAIRAVRAGSALPIVAQVTTGEDGHTPDGTPPDAFQVSLLDAFTLSPIVAAVGGLDRTDAFLNIQSDGTAFVSPNLLLNGQPGGSQSIDWSQPNAR